MLCYGLVTTNIQKWFELKFSKFHVHARTPNYFLNRIRDKRHGKEMQSQLKIVSYLVFAVNS